MSSLFKKAFKESHIDVPGEIKNGATHTLEWFYEQADYSLIEKVVPSCGCTADIDKLADRIRAIYQDKTKEEHFKDKDTLKLTKTMTVFYKDGKDLRVRNNRGVDIYNPEKANDVLTFSIVVKK